jgi:putative ABC transport system permease protein
MLGFRDGRQALGHHVSGRPIVGVVHDFFQSALHSPIKPLAISSSLKYAGTIHLALNGTEWKTTIAQVQAAFKSIYPAEEFTYTFFDESIARFY